MTPQQHMQMQQQQAMIKQVETEHKALLRRIEFLEGSWKNVDQVLHDYGMLDDEDTAQNVTREEIMLSALLECQRDQLQHSLVESKERLEYVEGILKQAKGSNIVIPSLNLKQ
jgi:hypothetical protein